MKDEQAENSFLAHSAIRLFLKQGKRCKIVFRKKQREKADIQADLRELTRQQLQNLDSEL